MDLVNRVLSARWVQPVLHRKRLAAQTTLSLQIPNEMLIFEHHPRSILKSCFHLKERSKLLLGDSNKIYHRSRRLSPLLNPPWLRRVLHRLASMAYTTGGTDTLTTGEIRTEFSVTTLGTWRTDPVNKGELQCISKPWTLS